jgi:hypothetical protein
MAENETLKMKAQILEEENLTLRKMAAGSPYGIRYTSSLRTTLGGRTTQAGDTFGRPSRYEVNSIKR